VLVIRFARYDGQLRKISLRSLVPIALGMMAFEMHWALAHKPVPPEVGLPSAIPLASRLRTFGVVLLLLRLYPSFDWLDRVPWLDRIISATNQRAMTICLWGNVDSLIGQLVGGKSF
jgi:hypothetical protein